MGSHRIVLKALSLCAVFFLAVFLTWFAPAVVFTPGGGHFLLAAQYGFSGPNIPNNEARPMDCSKASDPEYCALHNQAQLACREKIGRDYRRCLNAQLPGPPAIEWLLASPGASH